MTSGKAIEDQRRRLQEALETVSFAKLSGGRSDHWLPSPLATSRVGASACVPPAGRRVAFIPAEVSPEGQKPCCHSI